MFEYRLRLGETVQPFFTLRGECPKCETGKGDVLRYVEEDDVLAIQCDCCGYVIGHEYTAGRSQRAVQAVPDNPARAMVNANTPMTWEDMHICLARMAEATATGNVDSKIKRLRENLQKTLEEWRNA